MGFFQHLCVLAVAGSFLPYERGLCTNTDTNTDTDTDTDTDKDYHTVTVTGTGTGTGTITGRHYKHTCTTMVTHTQTPQSPIPTNSALLPW